MVLPELCPLDGKPHCKKRDCHLYHVEWRTGEEQCIIGYRTTHKIPSRDSNTIQDNYAANTRVRLGRDFTKEPQTSHTKQVRVEEVIKEDSIDRIAVYPEETIADGDATVIRSDGQIGNQGETILSDVKNGSKRNRKSIDDAMRLDLPDNYEEEFWS